MTSAVMIPGAGGLGWYWHLVERELQDRGYDAFAVDLAARGATGLPAYADAVVDAIDGRTDVALIAQSMGAFTAPLVWQRVPIRFVAFVNAMIPRPGETSGQWWENVGSEQARRAASARGGYSAEFDLTTYFMHDVPDDLVIEMRRHAAAQLGRATVQKRGGPVLAPERWRIRGKYDPQSARLRLARPGNSLRFRSHANPTLSAVPNVLQQGSPGSRIQQQARGPAFVRWRASASAPAEPVSETATIAFLLAEGRLISSRAKPRSSCQDSRRTRRDRA